MSLHLIFEHVDGDLSAYLEKCPAPGLPLPKIKVCSRGAPKGKIRVPISQLSLVCYLNLIIWLLIKMSMMFFRACRGKY